MTISQRIFEELKKQKKKQKELADYIGLSTSAISDWKKKGTNPAAEKISVIADFFGVSVDYLLTGRERDETKEPIKAYNSVRVRDMTNSNIVTGNGNNSDSDSNSISDDAIEIDKIIKSFDTRKRVKFLSQIYDLADELMKD